MGLMDALRFEVMDKNITVTNVCPGPVQTNGSKNALTADGSKFGRTDKIVAEGMPVKRCAELILVATCNKVREAWISKQPFLLWTYLGQYCPSLCFLWTKKMTPMMKIEEQ